MFRKVLAALIAALMLATGTAFAAPDETAAPTESAAPAESVAPADTTQPEATPAPTAQPNPFIDQVKAMRDEVRALRGLLATERQYDRDVHAQIKEIQGIVQLDKQQVTAFKNELKALTNKLKDLTKQLKSEQKKKLKNRDQAKIDALKAQIKGVEDEIAALKAKYQPLVDAIKGNRSGRRSLQPLRDQLKPKYDALKPLVRDAKTLNDVIRSLTVHDLKDALKANDQAKATEVVAQIRAKIEELKANINARIAIRLEMKKMLDDFKAQLQAVTQN